jgi:alcohol dehydrogenase class IV
VAVISAGSCAITSAHCHGSHNYITQIQFEFGAISLLRQQCERVGIRRPLIVTDRGVKAAGIIDTVLDALAHAGAVALYDGTSPNPNEAAVREAVRAYKEGDCDGIVAVGGGSSIDLAKGVAVCATHDGPLQSFAVIEGETDRITSRTAPVIAVPTTASRRCGGHRRRSRRPRRRSPTRC